MTGKICESVYRAFHPYSLHVAVEVKVTMMKHVNKEDLTKEGATIGCYIENAVVPTFFLLFINPTYSAIEKIAALPWVSLVRMTGIGTACS